MKLADIVVAAAIAFVLIFALVRAAHAAVFAASHLDERVRSIAAADRLAERLESDAASAWSIFVPAKDVLGAANADGHELDFFTEDASHRQYWWAYDFSPAARRVTVYAYEPGMARAAGDVFDGITGFAASTRPVTDLARPGSPVYDPLFAGSSATPVDFDYGWNSAAMGGNRLAAVALTGTGVARNLVLATATAPTHFTVVVDYTPAPSPTP